jgi:Zn-dependent protease with chaperone function
VTAWLGLLLVAAAAGAAAAGVASGLVWSASRTVRRLQPTRRADLIFALALLPGFAALAVTAAVVAPSMLHGLSIRPDHCAHHGHHAHLCAIHGALPPSWLAALGAVAVVLVLGRGLAALARVRRASARVERLVGFAGGSTDSDIVWVPGSPWLCLAIGVRRPRVLVSRSLPEALGEARWRAALAHERAHLRRRDPATSAVLALAEAWIWPGAARALVSAWREAAEQAADAAAARETSPLDVAEAMVAVARLRPDASLQPALAAVALERRIVALLDGPDDRGSARPVGVLVGVTATALVLAVGAVDPMHHAIESLLAAIGR